MHFIFAMLRGRCADAFAMPFRAASFFQPLLFFAARFSAKFRCFFFRRCRRRRFFISAIFFIATPRLMSFS
jgi:hypothetical protein